MNRKLAFGLPFLMIALFSVSAFAQAPAPSTWVQHVIIVVQENRTPDNLFQDTTLFNNGADILIENPLTSPHAACSSGFLPLLPALLDSCFNPNHDHDIGFEESYDSTHSNWDNACTITQDHDSCFHSGTPSDNYTYVTNSTGLIAPYWQIAENYGFANYMFQTNQGPSFLAHQFLFSGTSAPAKYGAAGTTPWELFAVENPQNGGGPYHYSGCVADYGTTVEDIKSYDSGAPIFPNEGLDYTPPYTSGTHMAPNGFPCYDHASLADLLDHATPNPISWKYYIQSSSYDNSIWTAPNALNAICPFQYVLGTGGVCTGGNGQWSKLDDGLGDILSDISACNVPQVSWVIPDGQWSDHPGDPGADGGPSWVAAIVNAVGNLAGCPPNPPTTGVANWGNTVILVTWDDWGGFFDHVAPYQGYKGGYPGGGGTNGQWYVYGFRVPLLVVSQYTKAGYISGSINLGSGYQGENPPYVHDFGSILGFVEAAFNQPPYDSNGNGGNGCGIEYFSETGCNYPYADYFAPDSASECGAGCGTQYQLTPYPLEDFFNLTTPRSFTTITGATHAANCFTPAHVHDSGCFPGYPMVPDEE